MEFEKITAQKYISRGAADHKADFVQSNPPSVCASLSSSSSMQIEKGSRLTEIIKITQITELYYKRIWMSTTVLWLVLVQFMLIAVSH